MNVSRLLLSAALAASIAGPAFAQGRPVPLPTGNVIANGVERIAVEVSRGQLIKLPRPATAVFVADPAIAEVSVKSPTLVYAFGKKAGETTLFAVDERERVLADMRLTVTHDLSRLHDQIQRSLPDAEVAASSVQGGIILSGSVATPAQADEVQRIAQRFLFKEEQIINRLGVEQSNQINLRVRVVEISREMVKRFGINIDALSTGKFAFGVATGSPTTLLATAPVPGLDSVSGFPNAGVFNTRVNNSNTFFGAGRLLGVDLNGFIDALETEGLVTVLAEPNLTAVSGELASFLAGGEFPIPVPQDVNTITIQFKRFGVSLNFVPTVLSSGRVALRVAPEVSQLADSGAIQLAGFQIPALTTRRAETSVELASGQSLAIAGLIQNNVRNDLNKVPGLADIPILGALFRSSAFRRNETELVIIVTPYLVRPVAPTSRLATPTDGLIPPNDYDRVVRGKSYHEQVGPGSARAAGANAGGLVGPAGFSLD